MSSSHHVLLVPGFFGFANLGDFTYFGHVREFVRDYMARAGIDGEVRVVQTFPTASLARRATRVIETIAELCKPGDDAVVHLIGHSSGGLDSRLAVTPNVVLPTTLAVPELAARVRSVVTIASPHRGAPLANLLSSVLGAQVLRLYSLVTMYTLRTGRVPIAAVLYLVRLVSLWELPIASGTLINNLYRDLLADFSDDRRQAIEGFLSTVGDDQELLVQITPAGMDLFNASTEDRPTVRYASTVTMARPPGLQTAWAVGPSAIRQATHLLFAACYRIARGMPKRAIPLSSAQEAALKGAYGRLPAIGDNDGLVPTLSQVWGEVIHADRADHLDVIGHFYLPNHVPPYYDWLNSGQGYTLADFEGLWNEVCRFTFA